MTHPPAPVFEIRESFAPFFAAPTPRLAICVAHRRAGKTVMALQRLLWAAVKTKAPDARFGFISPFRTQSKNLAWDLIKSLAQPLRPVVQEVELSLRFPSTGAKITLYGADNPDALRGSYFDGVVLDEVSQMDPALYNEVVRPMLVDRQGFVIFIGTPKGRNFFYRLYQRAISPPPGEVWVHALLKASETGIIPPEELRAMALEMSPEAYAQELECDFSVGARGLVFTIDAATQIAPTPHDPALPVYTAWDLGVRNSTAIWFFQMAPAGGQIRAIDYLEGSGNGLPHYISLLNQKPYNYAAHYAPHDIQVQEFGTGRTRMELAGSLGIHFQRARRHSIADGIEAARALLPRVVFDPRNCERGIDALQAYHFEWSAQNQAFRNVPVQDWATHAADAFRCFAMSIAPTSLSSGPRPYSALDWSVPINDPAARARYDNAAYRRTRANQWINSRNPNP